MNDKIDLFIDMTDKRLEKIENKLDILLAKENKRAGMIIAISSLISLLFGIAEIWVLHK